MNIPADKMRTSKDRIRFGDDPFIDTENLISGRKKLWRDTAT
jgi:hypothetical protein